MQFNKFVSVVLIFSQISLVSSVSTAWGDDVVGVASPEATLLENVIALQGKQLPADQVQSQMSQAVSQYLATAPQTGGQERFQEALVSLGIYTPAQAAAFANAAQASAMRLASNADQISSTDELSSAMQTEVNELTNLRPTGAQFSACDMGPPIAIGGIITMILGGAFALYNPSCDDPSARVQTTATCINPGDHPHQALGYTFMAVGGVIVGIGAIMAFLAVDNC